MAQSSTSPNVLPRPSASAPDVPPRSCKVAVIGAGVSGLVAARELTREGHAVTVFEKSDRVGGTWVYSSDADSDPSGFDPARKVVHGSLYRSLRTNLPRPIMGFTDYPFPGPAECFGDPRFFPAHEEVLAFLEGFARETGVAGLVRFGAEVVRVRMGRRKDEWAVEFRRGEGAEEESEVEVFEAVVVCNGHHTEPRLADFPGIDKWPGEQIHSHNYRVPEPFQDQILVVIGKETSAHDISRELSKVAKEVHLASRSPDVEVGKLFGFSNIWQHSMISNANEDGLVVFGDGSSVHADVIFHCTGYKYRFPFLDTKETVSIDENRVGPLYKHVFAPRLAPWLSFVGIPYKAIIFMMLELQSRWVAQVLSEKITLPPEEDMVASIDDYYLQMDEMGKPKHYTHSLHPNQIEFLNWLAAEVGLPPLEDWRVQLYHTVSQSVSSHDDGYRDALVADYWIQQWQLSQQRVQSS